MQSRLTTCWALMLGWAGICVYHRNCLNKVHKKPFNGIEHGLGDQVPSLKVTRRVGI